MSEQEKHGLGERLAEAYHRMLDRLRTSREESAEEVRPSLREEVDRAAQRASDLGELSREEAERVAEYLRRDVEDAAKYLSSSGRELEDWLRFDLELVEQGLRDLFAGAVDQARVELKSFEAQVTAEGEWHTGEVIGLGTLECKSCGEVLHFHKPGHIPPCPRCHGTTYRRLSAGD